MHAPSEERRDADDAYAYASHPTADPTAAPTDERRLSPPGSTDAPKEEKRADARPMRAPMDERNESNEETPLVAEVNEEAQNEEELARARETRASEPRADGSTNDTRLVARLRAGLAPSASALPSGSSRLEYAEERHADAATRRERRGRRSP